MDSEIKQMCQQKITTVMLGRGGASNIYMITRLLPPAVDVDCQYCIKNANEPYELVVRESYLSRAA
jgi:hypothetical protein